MNSKLVYLAKTIIAEERERIDKTIGKTSIVTESLQDIHLFI